MWFGGWFVVMNELTNGKWIAAGGSGELLGYFIDVHASGTSVEDVFVESALLVNVVRGA